MRMQPMARQEPPARESGNCGPGYGSLPSCGPLANPFVPPQSPGPETYPPDRGVIRGTLFPGLDLPFMGMVNRKELPQAPMAQLQALGFALNELGLYLDTHPEDGEALELYRTYEAMYRRGRELYEGTLGPLTQEAAAREGTYEWLKDPWPWDLIRKPGKEG